MRVLVAIPPVPQVQELLERIGARGHVTFGGRLPADAKGFPASAWNWYRLTCRAVACLIGLTSTGAPELQGVRRGRSHRHAGGAE